uniref:Uncharacterized protein n=1 Tax=Populus trichocarpa TaxID=3694 RepID=A0A2K1X6D6_POPTR
MKAFLIACFLLATIVFSPLSTCTARELAERDYVNMNLADVSRGALNPHKPVYGCGRGNRYCVPKTPRGCPNPYKRNCGRH